MYVISAQNKSRKFINYYEIQINNNSNEIYFKVKN